MLTTNDKLQVFRLSLGLYTEEIKRFSPEEWGEIMDFAEKQGIMGLIFEGVKKIHDRKNNLPPQGLLLQWIGLVQQIHNRNNELNLRCIELSNEFRKAGFRTCILKGQGNALMYPDTSLRQPGDIDIWVDAERSVIIDYVRGRCKESVECKHHIDYPIYDDVSVEVHFIPRFLYNNYHNKAFTSFVEQERDEQFCNMTTIPSVGSICIPTFKFNVVYQLVHMMGHFIEDGIGLRQVTDFIYLLRQEHKLQIDYKTLLDEMGLSIFAQGIMWIGQGVYGLELKRMIIEPNEKAGKIILADIMETGNLGQYCIFLKSRGRRSYIIRVLTYLNRQRRISYVTQSESKFFLYKMIVNKLLSNRK